MAQTQSASNSSDLPPRSGATEPGRNAVIHRYTHFPHRFTLRATYAILVFASVILGTAITYGLDVHVRRMEFTTIYALHTSIAYTFSFIACDMATVRFLPGWGSYEARTVNKLWRILWASFFLGFAFHRMPVRWVVHLYSPQIIEFYSKFPERKPTHTLIFLVSLVIFPPVALAAIRFAFGKVRTSGEEKGAPIDMEANSLRVSVDNTTREIRHAHITHVSMEDHYSRIFFIADGEPRNILVRISLAKLMRDLPETGFIQVHRSHLVNVEHIIDLVREGRRAMVVVGPEGPRLPVSKHRLPRLRPLLHSAQKLQKEAVTSSHRAGTPSS